MFKDDYRHFVAIVAGENPEKILEKYDSKIEVNPYVVYKLEDAGVIKKRFIDVVESALKNNDLSKEERDNLTRALIEAQTQNDTDFFFDYTDEFDHDRETGDAISTKNPYGKWSSCRIGKLFSVPFLTKDGIETFTAKKGDIDWEKIHMHGQEIYCSAWDVVMENKTPENKMEQEIYENMKNRTTYFQKFGTRENYVASCTAFWGYAFVDENGWEEFDDKDQFKWMTEFFDRFISPLPDDTKLTIYECVK